MNIVSMFYTYVGVFQLFKARSYIQRESSSRPAPDFPREDDNRYNQVLFHLHPRIVCLRLRWVTPFLITYSSETPLFISARFVLRFSFPHFLRVGRLIESSCSALGMNQLMWYYADLEKMKCYHTSDDLPDFDNQEKACSIWRRFAKYDNRALLINIRKNM